MLLISQRSSVRHITMHASAYEVGLRDVFEEDEACFTDLYVFEFGYVVILIDSNSIVQWKLGLERRN